MRPRALMVAPVTPRRTGNGLAMRLGVFMEALARVAEVDLLAFPSAEISEPDSLLHDLGVNRIRLPGECLHDSRFDLISRIRDDEARLAALEAYGRPAGARAITLPAQAAIAALAREHGYRLVHVGRSYMIEAGLAAALPGTALTLDLDEDDLRSFEMQAGEAAVLRPVAARRFRIEGRACDRLVERHGDRFDRVFVAGADDAGTLRARHPCLGLTLIPNSIALPAAPRRAPQAGRLLFVGTMSYPPNRAGMAWFVASVLPRLRALAGTDIRVEIVGPGTPASLDRPEEGIEASGYVADLAGAYERATLVIAPLLSGGGTRIKLLEAAAHLVPIVATSVAAAGLPFRNGASAWIADGPEDFARACSEALAEPAEAARRAAAACAVVAAGHERDDTVRQAAAIFASVLPAAA